MGDHSSISSSPFQNFIKAMCLHETVEGLLKNCPRKIHKAPCTICYTERTKTINKGTTVDTSKIQPGELVHTDFAFYNVTSILVFTSMLTVVCAKTRML